MLYSRSLLVIDFKYSSVYMSIPNCLQFLPSILPAAAAAAAKSLQSCPTLCGLIDGSPPGSLVPGILQARMLEWVAISFSNAWKQKVKVKSLSCVWLFATPRTVAYQAPLSMGFSRQEYWSGVPLPSPILYLCYVFNILIIYCVSQLPLHLILFLCIMLIHFYKFDIFTFWKYS